MVPSYAMKRAWLAFAAVTISLAAEPAVRADVPPPPGRTRVAYRFRLDQAPEGRVIVAFPTYNFTDGAPSQVLEVAKDYNTVQGYQPGIYSLDRADASALPKKYDEAKAFLESHAAVCLKQVPRVFEVPTGNGFNEVTDTFRVSMADGKCRTQLTSTTYRGNGKSGQGGVLSNGKRRVPAPFRGDVPPVTDSGLDLSAAAAGPIATPTAATPTDTTPTDTTPTDASPPNQPSATPVAPAARSVGCAGCTTAGQAPLRFEWVAVALGLLGAFRATRRKGTC